ncbi:uncharacterized protein PHACADRAFT_108850, partial [Phanerochaete carnosa HHB-10118-sp]
SSKEEWELARFLAKSLGHNKIDEFLKLNMISKLDLGAKSKYKFFQELDELPAGSQQWHLNEITFTGDKLGNNRKLLTEKLEIWRHDSVECIRELIGNPMFCNCITYAPEHVFLNAEGKQHCVDDMWTADWW